MTQNSSAHLAFKVLAPVRREKPLDELIKAHKHWPFTVAGVFAALQSEDSRLSKPATASSFIS
jgi:hypothetical protein